VEPIVSTDWLAAHLHDPDLRIVDVRWYLDPARRGRDAYAAGHIPGAIFLDVETDLSAPGGGRGSPRGRHPWPSEGQVSRVMSAAGIGPGVRVVAYDDQAGAIAARLWYLLRSHGHEDAAVLDGGIVKWTAEGRVVDTKTPKPPAATFTARLRPGSVIGKDEVAALTDSHLVLDARAPDRYRGEVEPIDPRAGHIPGAKSADPRPPAAGRAAGPLRGAGRRSRPAGRVLRIRRHRLPRSPGPGRGGLHGDALRRILERMERGPDAAGGDGRVTAP